MKLVEMLMREDGGRPAARMSFTDSRATDLKVMHDLTEELLLAPVNAGPLSEAFPHEANDALISVLA